MQKSGSPRKNALLGGIYGVLTEMGFKPNLYIIILPYTLIYWKTQNIAKPVISLPLLEPAYIRIPSDRIAALIGKGGETKREIEIKTGTKIMVNSEDGEVEISPKGNDWAVVESL